MKKEIALILALLLLAGCTTQDAPIRALQSSGQHIPTEASTAPSEEPSEEPQDDRGIDGMSSFALRTVYSAPPFNIPFADDRPAPDEAKDSFAASCDAQATSNTPYGEIDYDYALVMDSDGDIISGTVGVTSQSVSNNSLRSAADLYFYTLLLCADVDDASDLVSIALDNASTEGYEFTTEAAKFTAYWNESSSYWLSVEKAEV